LRLKHKGRRRKHGSYPLSHLYRYFGLVRLTQLSGTRSAFSPILAWCYPYGLGLIFRSQLSRLASAVVVEFRR